MIQPEYLLYFISNDQEAATITFTIADKNMPITVTIRNKNGDGILKLNCFNMLTIERLRDISCRLFNEESAYYRLDDSEGCRMGEKDTMHDVDDEANEFQFQFICKASVKCSIKFQSKVIELPCYLKTPVATIKYGLFIMDNKNEYAQIDLNDLNVENVVDKKSTKLEEITTLHFKIE
ncbi:unnamed protein product [Didymodactylos carnosus]|uniref:Uncharacterized protein n=1 Tax=Didymodactylos carnosus TaxID=1234261 RepID=A0A814AJY7_9BILA|nr:unnamed protein product [Didymodactylos carnosus]CAF3695557.1 unnamed protein product [Didymodactylos carnosus]